MQGEKCWLRCLSASGEGVVTWGSYSLVWQAEVYRDNYGEERGAGVCPPRDTCALVKCTVAGCSSILFWCWDWGARTAQDTSWHIRWEGKGPCATAYSLGDSSFSSLLLRVNCSVRVQQNIPGWMKCFLPLLSFINKIKKRKYKFKI